jgi:hypothetical protein
MNYYDIFVIDFLHEFELGVWKAVLTHLIRMLHVCGEEKVQMFNQRYVHNLYWVSISETGQNETDPIVRLRHYPQVRQQRI